MKSDTTPWQALAGRDKAQHSNVRIQDLTPTATDGLPSLDSLEGGRLLSRKQFDVFVSKGYRSQIPS